MPRSSLERVERGHPVWRCHPNGTGVAAVAFHPDDALEVEARGYVMANGYRATIVERILPDEAHNVAFRIAFDGPYPYQHP